MTNILRNYFINMHLDSVRNRDQQIIDLLQQKKTAKLLDLGCDTGDFTLKVAQKINTKYIYGVEIIEQNAKKAEKKGIKTSIQDIEKGLPFKSGFFDVVHCNQVIEHLFDIDFFVSEINRVLKRSGYCIISTENLASWHNIFCLLCGKQPFSTMISKKVPSCGNPFTLHSGLKVPKSLESWIHNKIFTVSSLRELFEMYQFKE